MFYDSVEAMAKDAPNVLKRQFAAGNIAYNGVNVKTLSDAGEQGAGENSAGLAANNPAQSEEFVGAREQQANAAQEMLAAAVYGILDAAASAARGGPPGMAQATQAQAKAQVQALVKRVGEQEKSKATMVAQIQYDGEVEKKAKEVEERLFAATAASTKEEDESVTKAREDARDVYTTRPKDPMVNVVA